MVPRPVVHLPGLRRALRDRLEHAARVEARVLGEAQALGERFEQARDADLVHHLRELPGAGGSDPQRLLRVAGEQRLRAREGRFAPARPSP